MLINKLYNFLSKELTLPFTAEILVIPYSKEVNNIERI